MPKVQRAGMELCDLPDECILHAMNFMPDATVLNFAQTCKRVASLRHTDTVWLPRLWDEYGMRLRAPLPQNVTAMDIYRTARSAPAEQAIRFFGCFTDGGCDEDMQQYWVDSLFAPNVWESYCSALSRNVNCIGLLLDGAERAAHDETHRTYREYLIRRLRLPAGVVYGHGLVNLGVLQGMDGDVGEAIVTRLSGYSTAELEHLFLEFHGELNLGHAIGRLMLHGLNGQERERERAFMTSTAQRIVQRLQAKLGAHLSQPGHEATLYDPVPRLDPDAKDSGRSEGRPVGVVERLRISRAGNFSCPVRAGVVFLASFNADACGGSQEAVLQALQDVTNSPECRAFDELGSVKALGDAVHRGLVPCRERCMVNGSGVYYTFCRRSSCPAAATSTKPVPVGPLQPLVWFRFHSKGEARKWAALRRPRTLHRQRALWQDGADPDAPQPPQPAKGADEVAEPSASAAEAAPSAAEAAPSVARSLGQLVGNVRQLAQAWLSGGAGVAAGSSEVSAELAALLASSSDDDDDSDSEEEGADGEGEGNAGPEAANIIDFDMTEEGDPNSRGTKGRDMLEVPLTGRWAGNLALVKLLNQENLMHEWHDLHEEPNIDANHVAFLGRVLPLPPGVALASA